MIKAHCNICDKVVERHGPEGSMIVVSSLNNVVLYVRPMFKKKDSEKELKLTLIQKTERLEDSIETGHVCAECLLKLLSNSENQVLGK